MKKKSKAPTEAVFRQWFYDGVAMQGETGPSYNLKSGQDPNKIQLRVWVEKVPDRIHRNAP